MAFAFAVQHRSRRGTGRVPTLRRKAALFILLSYLVVPTVQAAASSIQDSPFSALTRPYLQQNGNRVAPGDSFQTIIEKASAVLTSFGDVAVAGTVSDEAGLSVKFAHFVNGIEVYGLRPIVHFDRTGKVGAVTHAHFSVPRATAKLSLDDLAQVLADRHQKQIVFVQAPKLQYVRDFSNAVRLAWHAIIETSGEKTDAEPALDTFVDAISGEVFLETDRDVNAVGPKRTVYYANTRRAAAHLVQGPQGSSDLRPQSINFDWYIKILEDGRELSQPATPEQPREIRADASALAAYQNLGKIYEYYDRTFHWKSFDGQDSRMNAVVHAGVHMNQAKWDPNTRSIVFGSGDGVRFSDFSHALDVAGHEFTHGVISSTTNLYFAGEPGALGESYADFLGRMISTAHTSKELSGDDWLIGKEVVLAGYGHRALRNLEDPGEFGQPDNMSSPRHVPTNVACTSANDRCGVHANSGIPSRAAVLVSQAIGRAKAEKLWFRTMTQGLAELSNFAEARTATETQCALLFGGASRECKAVADAFTAVGI